MLDRIFVVSGLGYGDEGKGGVAHKLSTEYNAKVVFKFGGAQGSHTVVLEDGTKFAFSHFGCGTFEEVPTYLTEGFVAIPKVLIEEVKELWKFPVRYVLRNLSADPNVLCATEYHMIYSRVVEMARKNFHAGTCGTGTGFAYTMSQENEELAIRFKDLLDTKKLEQKLRRIANSVWCRLKQLRLEDFWEKDQEVFLKYYARLQDEDFFQNVLADLISVGKMSIRQQSLSEYLREFHGGVGITECSHGVLTDKEVGFTPYTTALPTKPEHFIRLMERAGFDGAFTVYGVVRVYGYRHGPGPFPTENKEFFKTLTLTNEEIKEAENRFRGEVRVGPLDFRMLRYVLDRGGRYDGVAVTCIDHLKSFAETTLEVDEDANADSVRWQYCVGYRDCPESTTNFTSDTLEKVYPQIESAVFSASADYWDWMLGVIRNKFQKNLWLPVIMMSFGPKDSDKKMF